MPDAITEADVSEYGLATPTAEAGSAGGPVTITEEDMDRYGLPACACVCVCAFVYTRTRSLVHTLAFTVSGPTAYPYFR